jgi:hypothetical protein
METHTVGKKPERLRLHNKSSKFTRFVASLWYQSAGGRKYELRAIRNGMRRRWTMKTAARNVVTSLGALTILSMLVMGCMLDPGDGESLANYADPISFQGYSGNPDQTVTLEYKRGDGSWSRLGTTRSSSRGSTIAPLTGYYWSRSFTVPADGWNGCPTSTADVRARTGSTDLYSVVPDWVGCWVDNGQNWNGFIYNCMGPNNPVARITAFKPCPPPPECEHADGEPCTKISQSCSSSGVLTGEWVCNESTGNNTCNVECPPPECEHADGEPCMGVPGGCPSNVVVTGEWVCNESTGQNTCNLPGPGAANGYCVSGLDPSEAPGCPSPSGSLCIRDSDCQPGLKCEIDSYGGGTRVICRTRPQPYDCTVPHCWLYSQQDSVCP